MLRLSKKADYALMAMKHLAMRQDAGVVQRPRNRRAVRDPARAAGEGAAAAGARAAAALGAGHAGRVSARSAGGARFRWPTSFRPWMAR